MDQRICIKFCVKNKIKCADAFRVVYGEATLDRRNVYRWYKLFSEGREDVNDEERAGRTSTTDENIDEVKKIVLVNRRITVREVAEDLNISISRNSYQNWSISTKNSIALTLLRRGMAKAPPRSPPRGRQPGNGTH